MDNELYPRPWRVSIHRTIWSVLDINIIAANDTLVCRMAGAGTRNARVLDAIRANAELIVKTANRTQRKKAA